ncbi:hypothetical protein [Salinicoccus sp. HZC-1]|uniref:hypothetical protein n=1 Tax=Salinicoccus sp. HZC-1 TaxID=3385497 RepID=UPI00398B4A14
MKAKFLIFASIFLCGCGQDATQSIERDDFQAKPPQLITINHYSLPLDDADNREVAAGQTAEADGDVEYSYSDRNPDKKVAASKTMHSYTNEEATGIEKVTGKANSIHANISEVWNKEFVPMYRQYSLHGIENAKVAEELEILHAAYRGLEQEVQSIKPPDFLTSEHAAEIEEMKSDLSLAISNRALALIEFKLMNEAEGDNMHPELLDIHMKNSRQYLNSAEAHMETLAELDAEDYSAEDSGLITTNK